MDTPESVEAASPVVESSRASPPAASVPESDSSYFGLRRGDQLFVGACVIAGLILLIVYTLRLTGSGQQLIEIDRLPSRQYDYQLDVNRATWMEWTLLEGIGETLAKRIVADREERGPFKTVEEVRRVRGIGPKTWERIRPSLKLGQNAATSAGP